jgi:uncharacterized protein (DUF2225 family)/CRP-like cAMP-binding protein
MDINVQKEILKRSSLLRNIPDYTINNIAQHTKIISLSQGDTLFNEGDVGDSLYIIGTGSVTLYIKTSTGEETPVMKHHTGDYFGEIAFFNNTGKRTVSAKAESNAVLFSIPREILMFLLQQNTVLAQNLLENLSLRLNAAYQQLATQTINELNDLDDTDQFTVKQEDIQADINEMLYKRTLECPHCRAKFTTLKLLTKYISIEKTDNDFCNHYKGVNPLYYDVAVCPTCGFAFTEESQEPFGLNAVDGVKKLLATLPKKNYNQIRDINLARETFALAIKTQTAAGGKHSIIAKLYLRLAWLYRYQGDTLTEYKFIEQAIKHYETAFTREKLKPRQEIMLLYLVGELFDRIGDPKMAVNWFQQATTHPQKHTFMGIVNRARDRWQDIRAEMKKA